MIIQCVIWLQKKHPSYKNINVSHFYLDVQQRQIDEEINAITDIDKDDSCTDTKDSDGIKKYTYNSGLVEYAISEPRLDSLKRLTGHKFGDIIPTHELKPFSKDLPYVETYKSGNFFFDSFPHLFPIGFNFDENFFENCFAEKKEISISDKSTNNTSEIIDYDIDDDIISAKAQFSIQKLLNF